MKRGNLTWILLFALGIIVGFYAGKEYPSTVTLRTEPPPLPVLPDRTYCGEASVCLTDSAFLIGEGWSLGCIMVDGTHHAVYGTCDAIPSFVILGKGPK